MRRVGANNWLHRSLISSACRWKASINRKEECEKDDADMLMIWFYDKLIRWQEKNAQIAKNAANIDTSYSRPLRRLHGSELSILAGCLLTWHRWPAIAWLVNQERPYQTFEASLRKPQNCKVRLVPTPQWDVSSIWLFARRRLQFWISIFQYKI